MLIVRSRATAVVLLVVAALYHLLAGASVCAIGWLAVMYYLWDVRRVQVRLGGQFEDLAGAGVALILVAWGCVLLWLLRVPGMPMQR